MNEFFCYSQALPPVRNSLEKKKRKKKNRTKQLEEKKERKKKINSYDYRAWDKFDVVCMVSDHSLLVLSVPLIDYCDLNYYSRNLNVTVIDKLCQTNICILQMFYCRTRHVNHQKMGPQTLSMKLTKIGNVCARNNRLSIGRIRYICPDHSIVLYVPIQIRKLISARRACFNSKYYRADVIFVSSVGQPVFQGRET